MFTCNVQNYISFVFYVKEGKKIKYQYKVSHADPSTTRHNFIMAELHSYIAFGVNELLSSRSMHTVPEIHFLLLQNDGLRKIPLCYFWSIWIRLCRRSKFKSKKFYKRAYVLLITSFMQTFMHFFIIRAREILFEDVKGFIIVCCRFLPCSRND